MQPECTNIYKDSPSRCQAGTFRNVDNPASEERTELISLNAKVPRGLRDTLRGQKHRGPDIQLFVAAAAWMAVQAPSDERELMVTAYENWLAAGCPEITFGKRYIHDNGVKAAAGGRKRRRSA